MFYLEDFIVSEPYRNLGIGQQLMEAYLQHAQIAGCVLVKWEVLDWNEDAIKFYKKMGCIIDKHWYNVKKFLVKV